MVLQNGYLASVSNQKIKIWNTDNFNLIRTLTGHTGEILSLVVLPNGYLASTGYDNTIIIWNTDDGSIIRNVTDTTGLYDRGVYALAVLKNGYLASGSSDYTIKIWNFF